MDSKNERKRYPYGASLFFITISCIALGILIVSPAHNMKSSDKLYIVCTTGIVADLVCQIGGNLVNFDTLMGVGVDPHMYRARESDMHKIAQADIILYHGLHLEGKMATMFSRMQLAQKIVQLSNSDAVTFGDAGVAIVSVSHTIPTHLLKVSECADIYDPHIWHDVSLWRYAAIQVGEILQKKDPKNKKVYEKNMVNYLEKLDVLDQYIHNRMATIPSHKRILITAHDAFGYFGKAYGCEVIGLQGISTDSEISACDITRIVEVICTHNVRVVFVESLIPERTIQAVRQAVLARGLRVDIGKELFSDALGNEESGAHTYIDMIKHNVEVIVEALASETYA